MLANNTLSIYYKLDVDTWIITADLQWESNEQEPKQSKALMHNFWLKTLWSKMTFCRIRLLVEKNGLVRHLVDFMVNEITIKLQLPLYEGKSRSISNFFTNYDTWSKKINQVSDDAVLKHFYHRNIFFLPRIGHYNNSR